jgi:hypothetical protein
MTSGVAGGNSDMPTASGLDGDCTTALDTNSGTITGNITGSIRFCASLMSLPAAPMAMLNEP